MQVAQTHPPSPIPQNTEAIEEPVWKWQPPIHPGGMWELRRLTDEELNYAADEGKTEQELIASVAMAAARWHRTASIHQPSTCTPTASPPKKIYQVAYDAKEGVPVASDDAFFATTSEEIRHSGGEAYACSNADQVALPPNLTQIKLADGNGEAHGVLSRNRTAEPCFIPGSSHPRPIHDGPSPKVQNPLPCPAVHITSLQSPPMSPNALIPDAKVGLFGSFQPVSGAFANLVESPVPPLVVESLPVPPLVVESSPVRPLVVESSPNFLKRRRASTTAMYDFQHSTNTSYNDDNAMKRSKSSSTAICHPKKRKMSAIFIKNIENDVTDPIYMPRASSTISCSSKKRKMSAIFIKSIENDVTDPIYMPRASSTFSCSSELSTASNYSSSASSSQEDSYKPHPERRHHCNLCSASFARGHDLRRHERTHTNVRDHKCSVCGREFSRRDALQRHTGVCDGQRKAGKKHATTSAKRNVSAGPVTKTARKSK